MFSEDEISLKFGRVGFIPCAKALGQEKIRYL